MPYLLHTPSISRKAGLNRERNQAQEKQGGPWRGNDNHWEGGEGEKGGLKDAWRSLGLTLRNSKVKRRGQMWCPFRDCGLDFEYIWFYVVLWISKQNYGISGTACEPGLLRYSEADVSPRNKNMRIFQKEIPEPLPALHLVRPQPRYHTTSVWILQFCSPEYCQFFMLVSDKDSDELELPQTRVVKIVTHLDNS